jgi:hypothetical protein
MKVASLVVASATIIFKHLLIKSWRLIMLNSLNINLKYILHLLEKKETFYDFQKSSINTFSLSHTLGFTPSLSF